MDILNVARDFFNPKAARLQRELEMSEGGSPDRPDLAVKALLGVNARIINDYDNTSFSAANNHQLFRELVKPLLAAFERRTGLKAGDVYINFVGSSSANRIPASEEYRFLSTNSQSPNHQPSIHYDVWMQNDNGVANIYAKTVNA